MHAIFSRQTLAGIDCLLLARWLMLAQMVALMFSPPVTNLMEFCLYLVFALCPQLRGRLIAVWQQPMVRMLALFFAVLAIAVSYSISPVGEGMGMLWGWRRLAMLPLAAAIFDDDAWKIRAAWVFVIAVTFCVIVSYLTWWLDTGVYKYAPGIVIRNYALQGMLFAVGAFVAVSLLLFGLARHRRQQVFLVLAALALFLNVLLVTNGRSGYLVLLVLLGSGVFAFTHGWKRWLLLLFAPALLGGLLMLSPVAKQRILLGIHEVQNYAQLQAYTSMGVRLAMLDNTLQIVRQHPWLGVGTGGFEAAYRRQVEGVSGWRGVVSGDPHNQYLKILAEQGIPGLIVFLGFIVSMLRQNVTGFGRVVGVGVLLSWCATSLFSSHFSTFAEGRFLMIWCGVMLSWNLSRGEPASSDNT